MQRFINEFTAVIDKLVAEKADQEKAQKAEIARSRRLNRLLPLRLRKLSCEAKADEDEDVDY